MEQTPTFRKMEWRRAWNALRILIDDPKRTEQVFEITDALSGRGFERGFQKFRAHPDGRRLLAERPSLLATLADRAALRALPVGSFGRAYVEFMESGNLSAEGLVQAEAMAELRYREEPDDPARRFYGERIRDMHDLWHVLSGYGMDEAGEAANLAFTFSQIPNLGIGLIVGAAALLGPSGVRWQRYLFRAWRRGRRAALLTVAPYEQLLAQPLDEVRALLRIQPARAAHPEGILVGNGTDGLKDWIMAPLPT